jgi:hypothetical protein
MNRTGKKIMSRVKPGASHEEILASIRDQAERKHAIPRRLPYTTKKNNPELLREMEMMFDEHGI